MKNLAILTNSLTGGGAERVAGILSKYLDRYYNVFVFTLNTNIITYDYGGLLVDLAYDNIEECIDNIKKSKEKYDIHITISFLSNMNAYNVITGTKDKVIVSSRCCWGEADNTPHKFGFEVSAVYNSADAVVACSYGVKYDLINNYAVKPNHISTIYNFIDKEDIIKNSHENIPESDLNFLGKSKWIINVGRLDKQKNQTKLLVQFKRMLDKGFDLKLVIIGSGNMENYLKNKAKELELCDKVLFKPYCRNPFPYYKKAEMMVCSTDFEGLPNVVLEAMVLGLPVVSVDCLGGPMELIKGKTDYSIRTKGIDICKRGILVEKSSSDTSGETTYLAEAMETLISDKELSDCISKNEIEYMKSYSNELVLSEWIKVIEKTPIKEKERVLRPSMIIGLNKDIIIFGAGVYAKRVLAIMLSNYECKSICMAVSKKDGNPASIMGVTVYELDELLHMREDAVVVIGVSSIYREEVANILTRKGFRYMLSNILLALDNDR